MPTDKDKASQLTNKWVIDDGVNLLANHHNDLDDRLATALSEVRRETWEAAISAVENMPTLINRRNVKRGGDLNGWYSAQQGALTALKNARNAK